MANLALINQVLFNGQNAPMAKYVSSKKVVGVSATTYTSNYFDVVFSTALVASNSVAGTVNGSALTATVYATSSAATLAAVAVKIAAKSGVGSAVVIGNKIRVYPSNANGAVALTSFAVTGGAGQPVVTYASGNIAGVAGTNVLLANLDGSMSDVLTVSNTVAAVKTALNTANTTNSVNTITLTVKNNDGTTASTTINVNQLLWAIDDPTDSADGIVAYADAANDRAIVVVTDENGAAVAALANA